jgi:hypothetical protein
MVTNKDNSEIKQRIINTHQADIILNYTFYKARALLFLDGK